MKLFIWINVFVPLYFILIMFVYCFIQFGFICLCFIPLIYYIIYLSAV